MKKRSKKIALTISIIVGIVTFIFYMWMSMPSIKLRINSPVTEEDYNMLKETALNYAKTLDEEVIDNENITSDYYVYGNELIVSVESSIAEVRAKIPILSETTKVDDGKISLNGTADYENITYIERSNIPPIGVYISFSVVISLLFACLTYMSFFRNEEK